MQNSSLPPEIPKQSLTPVWIGAGALLAIGGLVWVLSSRSSEKAKPEPAAAATPAASAEPLAAPEAAAEPLPPPPRAEHAPQPSPAHAIPAEVALPAPGSTRRDPNCDDPCQGTATSELESSLRAKASQARTCYERALSNDSALAGKLVVALRVGADGAACSASVTNDMLGDGAVGHCALTRFRAGKYPRPTGGCVNVSVPMNFMPAGSR